MIPTTITGNLVIIINFESLLIDIQTPQMRHRAVEGTPGFVKLEKGCPHVHHNSHSVYSVKPSHHRPTTKWVGMIISGALWLASIVFLPKVILYGAKKGPAGLQQMPQEFFHTSHVSTIMLPFPATSHDLVAYPRGEQPQEPIVLSPVTLVKPIR